MSIEEVLPVLVDWLTLGEVFRVIATSRTMRATIINEPSVWKGLALHRLGIGMLSRTTHGRARARAVRHGRICRVESRRTRVRGVRSYVAQARMPFYVRRAH